MCRPGAHSGFLLNVGLTSTKDVCMVLWCVHSEQVFYYHCMFAPLCVLFV